MRPITYAHWIVTGLDKHDNMALSRLLPVLNTLGVTR